MGTDDEKTAALLTPAHREYLRGERTPPNESAERALRSRIRARIKAGIEDFHLIWKHLSAKDSEQVFDSPRGNILYGIRGALGFIYRGTRDGIREDATGQPYTFERLLRQAIRREEYDPDGPIPAGTLINVRFEDNKIVVDKTPQIFHDYERIGEKIEAGDINELTRRELAWFVHYYNVDGALDPYYPARRSERKREELEELRALDEEGDPNAVKDRIEDSHAQDRDRMLERRERAKKEEPKNNDE